jgi:hypothetical protein
VLGGVWLVGGVDTMTYNIPISHARAADTVAWNIPVRKVSTVTFNLYAALMEDETIACDSAISSNDTIALNSAICRRAEVMALSRGGTKEATSVITVDSGAARSVWPKAWISDWDEVRQVGPWPNFMAAYGQTMKDQGQYRHLTLGSRTS